MFDTITFYCPSCGKELEAQSKSGECLMYNYNMASVPIDVAQDCNRHAPFKCECGKRMEFETTQPEQVRLSLRELN